MLTRDDFFIRDDVTFFNHGSFGACPKVVFSAYQDWQLELERQPVEFLNRRRIGLMQEATNVIADYLNVPSEEVVFVVNATFGLNTVAKSLKLNPGDQILTTDHEYGAINKTMQFVAEKTGADIVRHHVELPYTTDEAFTDGFFEHVTDRTKVILLSHITSPSALIFPVEMICQRAREMGIFTMIDGAHVPGQLALDLTDIGADVYSGNFHKWLCAPKGSAFLHVRAEHHDMIDPLVVSHGWYEGSNFFEQNEWQGTRDLAPYLTVPTAIQFQKDHNWEQVRADCHALAVSTQNHICDEYGLTPLSENQFSQMVTIPLPDCDHLAVTKQLYEDFKIEVPPTTVEDRPHIRVSFQAYVTPQDAQLLIDRLRDVLPS